jgi:hypothetical protein
MKSKTTITTKTTTVLKLTEKDIIEFLEFKNIALKNKIVAVEFRVPGGGDWSNTTLEISENYPIFVKIEGSTVEEH